MRQLEFERLLYVIFSAVCVWLYSKAGSIGNLHIYIINHLELSYALSLIIFSLYLVYRNYVVYDMMLRGRPGKMCIYCGKGMGYSDDGWKFKVYGKNKEKWYQVRACNTPSKCDIAYQSEIKWVNDDEG
ncbi:MAG: hypothetical protein ACQES2_11470 [Pseudomonadota bacterium]